MKASRRYLLVILVLIIAVVGLVEYYYQEYNLPPLPLNTTIITNTRNTQITSQPYLRALYYDSLYREYPNDTLDALIVTTLESRGYDVDVYLGKNATLDQLVNLQQYQLVIIRAHGGYSNRTAGTYPPGEYIFTGLYYNESVMKYGENINTWIKKGYLALGVIPPPGKKPSQEELEKLPKYLVVGPKFIEEKTVVEQGSIIIVFGCYTFEDGTLAKIMLDKGALAYVGWKGGVTPEYMDRILPGTVNAYLSHGLNGLRNFVNNTLPDPQSDGKLRILLRPSSVS
ncbi:MAG: hypothetical protein F7B60_00450 [Desulfurococcales archaeon]|nr:hypothetical protein [Desulfurococcales archaeon]